MRFDYDEITNEWTEKDRRKKKKKTKILNSPLPQVIKVGYVIYVGRVALMLEWSK